MKKLKEISTVTIIKVARIIRADGTALEDHAIAIDEQGNVSGYVHNGAIEAQSPKFRVEDKSEWTLLPLLADCHVHLGISDGLTESPRFHTLAVIDGELSTYLQAGVGHVLSLGTDQPWVQDLSQDRQEEQPPCTAVPYSAGCGFGAIDGWPPELTEPQLRYRPSDHMAAQRDVRALAQKGVKVIKLWVDSLGGKVPTLPEPIARAIISEAHVHGIKVFSHVFSERDARVLISLGINALAHSVRDRYVDDDFCDLMACKGVKLMPTLVREEVPLAYASSENPYLSDPLFMRCAGQRLRALGDESSTSDANAVLLSRRSLDIAMENLRRLCKADVEICLGTDAGFRLKLAGFSQHRELQLMCEAGLKPSQALAAALRNNYVLFAGAASSLNVGQRADFFLVEGSPLADIKNASRIQQVWRLGREVTANRLD